MSSESIKLFSGIDWSQHQEEISDQKNDRDSRVSGVVKSVRFMYISESSTPNKILSNITSSGFSDNEEEEEQFDDIELLSRFTKEVEKYIKSKAKNDHDSAQSAIQAAIEMISDFEDIDIQDENGNTMLHLACYNNMQQVVEYLLVIEARLDISNKRGISTLSLITALKDRKVHKELLILVTKRIFKEDGALLQLFVNVLARLDQKTKNYMLSMSILGDHKHISRLLLESGADYNAQVNKEVLGELKKELPNETNIIMFLTFLAKDNDLVRLLFEKFGARADLAVNGLNLLHFACLGGNTEMFEELVEMGLDVNAVGNEGNWQNCSVLMCAVRGEKEEIVTSLLSKVDIESAKGTFSFEGLTAFDYAIKQENNKMVYDFLKHNFTVDPSVKKFDFFRDGFQLESDQEINEQFETIVQEMITARPELLLRMAIEYSGEDLLAIFIGNEDLELLLEKVIREGTAFNIIPSMLDIVGGLNRNQMDEFRSFLDDLMPSGMGIHILRSCIKALPDREKATQAWQTLENTFLRYDQLSKVSIEVDRVRPYDNLRTALFIESHVAKVEGVVSRYFNSDKNLPMPIILHEREIIVLANNVRASGGQKCITNAALVSLGNLRDQPQEVVVAGLNLIRVKERGCDVNVAKKELLNEWRIMRKFKGVKGFVQGHYYLDLRSSNGNVCYVANRYEGDLGTFIGGVLNLDGQMSIAEQAIRHLKTMHDSNVMHGDLKPGNILFKRDPNQNIDIAFADFGFSKVIKDVINLPNGHGTAKYSPPELRYKFSKLDVSEQCRKLDIYALGLTLFSLFHGRKFPLNDNDNITTSEQGVFEKRHDEIVKDRLRLLTGDNKPNLYVRYEILILKLMAYDPAVRISLESALDEINEIIRIAKRM